MAPWRQPGKRRPWVSCQNTGSFLLPHSLALTPRPPPPAPVQGFAYQVGSLCYYSPVCSVLTMTLCVDWNRSLLHWPVKGRVGKSERARREPKLKQGRSRLLGRASASPTAWSPDHLCLLMGGGFPLWIYKLKSELPGTEKSVARAPTSDGIMWPSIGKASSLVAIELQKSEDRCSTKNCKALCLPGSWFPPL